MGTFVKNEQINVACYVEIFLRTIITSCDRDTITKITTRYWQQSYTQMESDII